MNRPEAFDQRELSNDLNMLRHFAQGVPPLAEAASTAVLHFSLEAAQLVDALVLNPDASPRELLLLAGEARARLDAMQGEFDMALHHLACLPVRVDLSVSVPQRPAAVRVPEEVHEAEASESARMRAEGGDEIASPQGEAPAV